MELKTGLFLSAAVFALLQFGLLPRLKFSWSRASLESQLKRFGVLAILDKLRTYSLIGFLCLMAFTVFVIVASSHLSDSPSVILNAMLRAQAANERIKHFKEFWTTWLFALSFLVLWAAWYRSANTFAKENLRDLRLKEYERLAKLRDEHPEDWKEIPPTTQMNEVWGEVQLQMQDLETKQESGEPPERSEQRLDYVRKLSTVWTLLDFDRRLEVHWDTELISGNGVISSVKRFASSRGFLSDMKGIGKLLSYASTALLFLSMVGFAAGAADESMSKRVSELSDLKITTAEKESEVALKAAEAEIQIPTTTSSQLTPQDHQYIRNISQHLAREVRGETNWPHSNAELRYEVAKEQIRSETVLASAPIDLKPPEEISGFEARTQQEDNLASKIEATFIKHAQENPGFMDRVRNWGGRYKDVAEIDELRGFFVEQLTDALFDTLPKPGNPLSSKTIDLFTDPIKKSAGEVLKTSMNRVMVSALRDTPQEKAWSSVRTEDSFTTVLSVKDLDGIRVAYPNSETQANWAKTLRTNRLAALSSEGRGFSVNIAEVVSNMPSSFALENQTALADLVDTYESQFPLIEKKYAREDLFDTLSKFRQKLKSLGREVPELRDGDTVATRVARAQDIEALRNYSRVGGVLIGKGPSSGNVLNIRDIAWASSGDQITIALIQADGSTVQIGKFDPDVINQALAYAVDGRPAAVTILNADLIDRQQVMMHPALRDSLLGAQIGRADEWVFDFLEPKTGPPTNSLRKSTTALYAATRIYDKALATQSSGKPDITDGRLVTLRSAADDGAMSAISQMEGFDAKLISVASACMKENKTEQDFATCVLKSSKDKQWVEKLRKTQKPRTAFVSQIYEQPYSLDPDLRFLRGGGAEDGIWPLQFTVQMTVNDKEHATLPQFQGETKIQSTQAVLAGVHGSGEDSILRRLKDFTLLQRLFRVALSGGLGDAFPVEKLSRLARQTHIPRPTCSTPRWVHREESNSESSEFALASYLTELPPSISFLRPAPRQISAAIRAKAGRCAALLGAPQADTVPSDRIKSTCTLVDDSSQLVQECRANISEKTESCVLLETDAIVASVASIHQLREALGAVRAPEHIRAACIASM